MPSKENDRRLVSDDVLKYHTALTEAFDAVEDKLTILWASLPEASCRDEVVRTRLGRREVVSKSILDRKADVDRLIAQDRYKVGFLGRSGVGKSTTINSVLGTGILTEGSSGPCTSTVTRTCFVPDNEKLMCKPRYMTDEQFDAWRTSLVKTIGRDGLENLTEEGLIEDLEARIKDRGEKKKEAEKKGKKYSDEDQVSQNELYLYLLLKSREKYAQFLRSPDEDPTADGEPEEDDDLKTIEQRLKELTSHDFEKKHTPSAALLLQEVELHIRRKDLAGVLDGQEEATRLKDLPYELELVDLPGLGVYNDPDVERTESYLQELHGALVFQSKENVKTTEAKNLLDYFREHFRGLRGRVWMIVTNLDGFKDDRLLYGERTFFHTLDEALQDFRMPAEQVLLVGNRVYDEWHKGTEQKVIDTLLHLRRDSNGDPIIPPVLTSEYKELLPAFLPVTRDGGIRNVWEVICTRIGESVKKRIEHDVTCCMEELARELHGYVKDAMNEPAEDDLIDAVTWGSDVTELSEQIDSEREILDGPATALRQELITKLDKMCGEKKVPGKLEDLRKYHTAIAERLRERAAFCLGKKDGTVQKTFASLANALEEAADDDPPQALNPMEEIKANGKDDANDLKWCEEELASFELEVLFPDDGQQYVTSKMYPRIMRRKVDAIVYQLTHKIANRAKTRLEKLAQRLHALGIRNRKRDNVADGHYKDILKELDKLLENLKKLKQQQS